MEQVRETELDLGALLSALWRRAWLLVLVAIAVAAGTYFSLGFVTPIYKAGARVLIEVRESFLPRPRDAVESVALQVDESAIQSYVQILLSRDIASRVIDGLELDRRPEFDPAAQPSLLDSLLVLAGWRDSPVDSSPRDRAIETYYDRLEIYPIGGSRVIAVDFTSPEPQLSAEVANAVADAFMAVQSEARRQSTAAATRWLEEEITELRQRVAEAEAAVEAYRAGSGLFASSTGDGSLTSQQLTDINAELARAKAARSEAESRAELVRQLLQEGGSLETASEVLSSPLIQRLRERQVALTSEIAELSATHLPSHPRIQALRMQLADLDAQIRREAEKVLQSLETAARVAAARQTALTESLNEAKAAAAQANEESIELRALEREARAERELLEAYLARYREAIARADSDYLPADARIISRAVAPITPSFPKKVPFSILAALAATILVAALILTRQFTSGRAFRIIGAAPAAAGQSAAGPRFEPELDLDAIGVPAPLPAIALPQDAPGTLEVARALGEAEVRVALFAGAEGGEGAGEVALAAARLAASDGARPVLLDVGMTPSPVLAAEGAPGLGELLSGTAAFGEVIRRMEGARLHFIAMGSAEDDPPLQRISLVVGALAHTYDKVIVVADTLADWPAEHVHPDLAAIVCGPDLDEAGRKAAYERALEQGARSAVVVRRVAEAEPAGESQPDEERQPAGAVA